MDLSRQQFLASTGLAENQHRRIGGRDHSDLFGNVPHWRTSADDLSEGPRFFLSEICIFPLEFPSDIDAAGDSALIGFHNATAKGFRISPTHHFDVDVVIGSTS